jgi:hypothetical protein
MKLIDRNVSTKKLSYLMLIIINCLSILSQIPESLSAILLSFFASRKDEFIQSQIARSLFLIASMRESGPHVLAISRMLATLHPLSPDAVVLWNGLSKTIGKELFEPAMTKHITSLFTSQLPSSFCAGLRLLARGLKGDMPEGRVKLMLRNSLSKMIDNFPKYNKLPTVSETAGGGWLAILTLTYLKQFRSQILSDFHKIMPLPSAGSFPAMAIALCQATTIALSDKCFRDVSSYANAVQQKLLVHPTSLFLLKVYLRLANVSAEKFGSAREKRETIMNSVNTWLGSSLNDSYSAADAVYEILHLVMKFCGVSQVIAMLKEKLLCGKCRFYPVFLALVKLTKHIGKTPTADKSTFVAEIKEVGRALRCKAHGSALRLVDVKEKAKLAVELAQTEDVDEMEFLMQEGRPVGMLSAGDEVSAWVGVDVKVGDWPEVIHVSPSADCRDLLDL